MAIIYQHALLHLTSFFFSYETVLRKYNAHNNYQKNTIKIMLMKNLLSIYNFSTKITFS